MSAFGSFAKFVELEHAGTPDATMRGYDLDRSTGWLSALKLLKRDLLEVQEDLAILGLPQDDLEGRLARWLWYYRIVNQKRRKYPMKSTAPRTPEPIESYDARFD